MPHPGHVDEDAQPAFSGLIQERGRRNRVGQNRVDAYRSHQLEITRNLGRFRKLIAGCVRRESSRRSRLGRKTSCRPPEKLLPQRADGSLQVQRRSRHLAGSPTASQAVSICEVRPSGLPEPAARCVRLTASTRLSRPSTHYSVRDPGGRTKDSVVAARREPWTGRLPGGARTGGSSQADTTSAGAVNHERTYACPRRLAIHLVDVEGPGPVVQVRAAGTLTSSLQNWSRRRYPIAHRLQSRASRRQKLP